jgi:hypothetical protein
MNTRTVRASLVGLALAALASSAHAVFFFFLPGSLFAAKGDSCVSSTAKVGDTITKDAKVFVIKALSGTSSRCSNSATPILAELEGKVVQASTTQARIDLPDGWVPRELTDAHKAIGIVSMFHNKTIDGWLQVVSQKKSEITNVADYVQSRKATVVNRMKEAEAFPTAEHQVNGLPAWRFEARGRLNNGVEVHVLSTFIESEDEIVWLHFWTTKAGMDAQRPKFQAISDSVIGLQPPRRLETASPPRSLVQGSTTAAAPIQATSQPTPPGAEGPAQISASATQRLRELNGMLKDGLITQQDYDEKKKQILNGI